jgi:rhodanese-related sulfurtransferase
MMKSHNQGFLDLVGDARSRVKEETAQEALARTESNRQAILVDVREESEFEAGHVAGAVHLSKGIIERDIETRYPDRSTELHLYCGGGFRSVLTADNLQKMGYTNVLSVDGGFRALQQAGAEIIRGSGQNS